MQSTPKVGVVDPTNRTLISTFQGKKQVDPATQMIEKVINSPLIQSVGAGSKIQEPDLHRKKQYSSLAIPPPCPKLEDDVQSPTPLQRRDPEPRRGDLVPKMEEKQSKRKRAPRAKMSTEDDSSKKAVTTK